MSETTLFRRPPLGHCDVVPAARTIIRSKDVILASVEPVSGMHRTNVESVAVRAAAVRVALEIETIVSNVIGNLHPMRIRPETVLTLCLVLPQLRPQLRLQSEVER